MLENSEQESAFIMYFVLFGIRVRSGVKRFSGCQLSTGIQHKRHKSYCSTVHFRRITSIYQPTNAHIISHKAHLNHFKTLRHVSILSDHHQGALFLAKVILRYSQFNSYLQTRCCGSISCCVVEQWLGVRRTTHT